MDYDSWLWGKQSPPCSLSRHMIAVGACTWEYLSAASNQGILALLSRWMGLPECEAIRLFSYIAALHDVGKAHPSFQKNADDVGLMTYIHNFRHEIYGAERLASLWREQGWDHTADFYSAVVSIHHQGKGDCQRRLSVSAKYEEIQRDMERRMKSLFRPVGKPPEAQNADALGVLLSAVLILCDWVASSEKFGAETPPDARDEDMLTQMRARSRVMLKEYGLISDSGAAYPRMREFSALWPAIPASGMRPLQRACEQAGFGKARLTIIEAPMGEGKTEAALYLAGLQCDAFDKRGVYMALPTAATSNQMFDRVRAMLEAHQAGSVRLMHSMAWLIDEKTPPSGEFDSEDAGYVTDWLRPLRRGMLSENAVGTVDQAMAAALKVKYGVLRLAGLAGKVLIIDEIHAYDIFMSTIIARLLEWCSALEIPVILLSATLQERQKQRYLRCYGVNADSLNPSYPLITQVTAEGDLIQTPVADVHMRSRMLFRTAPIGGDVAKAADLALERAKRGGCICVMMNTVRQAQAVYRELRGRGEDQVMLFHARYTANRRAEIEKACIRLFGKDGKRPERMILVCTQVVEQSLDVDFDGMITQLAPMDLLLQRAGRVHRHAGRIRPDGLQSPVIDVIVPDAGATGDLEERYAQLGGIYPPISMKNTEELLGQEKTVSVPENVRACVERAYADISDECFEMQIKKQVNDQIEICKAESELLAPPEDDEFFAETPSNALNLDRTDCDDMFVSGAQTRDGGLSQQFIFLPGDFPENDKSQEWLKKAMGYMCNIPVLKDQMKEDIKISLKGKCDKKIIIRADETDQYRWMGHTFSVSDEYGVEEVPK